MSTNNEVPVTTTPQPSYRDEAVALIDDIRAMKQRVPNFVVPERKTPAGSSRPPHRYHRRLSTWRRWRSGTTRS